MLDMSRNAVMRPDELKNYIKILASFGYNMVQLYTEDTYEVDGEPYFGYLRGRYTKEELKDVVAYAATLGVEVIPCIQTLAHLEAIFMWDKYKAMNDTANILLVDDERTYALVENMFRSIRECFTTDIIHIGMDEAHMLGLGKYLDKNGYHDRFELLSRHLKRVIAIAERYGFKPIMWSDMFFRIANGGEYYDWSNINDEVIAACPDGVGLVYWDYYHNKKEFYDGMLAAHNRFGREVWFAGGVWSWVGLAPLSTFSIDAMREAMSACRDEGVDNIMFTMWGDNGSECSLHAMLPALFNIKKFYDGVTDMEAIRREFYELTGEDYDAMLDLELPNIVAGNDRRSPGNVYKVMLFSDPLFGFADVTVKDGEAVALEYAEHKRTLAEHMRASANRAYLYETAMRICDVMEIKYDLGVRLRRAYKAGERDTLAAMLPELEECARRVRGLHTAASIQWHKENKPHGFEVHDARYGGLILRLDAVARRVKAYLDGKVDKLEELEEELLPFRSAYDGHHVIDGTPGTPGIPSVSRYDHIFTVNRV